MAGVIFSFGKIPIENLYLDDTYFVDPYADDDDSLSWELIDPSDDEADKFSYHSSLDNDDGANLDAEIKDVVDSPVVLLPDSDVFMESLMEQIDLHRVYVARPDIVVDEGVEIGGGDFNDDVDDDDDDNEEFDLDDELVPKWVNDRFERQRMRKLGKRAFPKMKNSKRLPLMYNKPGCVHGKHGLGLKHSLM